MSVINRDRRSIQQCRYLNGVVYRRLCSATGYERDDISEFMCGAYFGWKTVKVPRTPNNSLGMEDRPIRTTTTNETGHRAVLTITEFMDFVAFVRRFAADKGVYIPDPDPDYWMHEDAA